MSDLTNFINYDRVTSYPPKLSSLDFFSKRIEVAKGQPIVSLVSLVDNQTESDVDIPVEYQAVGFISDEAKANLTVELPIHMTVTAGFFNNVVNGLDKKLRDYDEAREVVIDKSIVSTNDGSTTEGLIL